MSHILKRRVTKVDDGKDMALQGRYRWAFRLGRQQLLAPAIEPPTCNSRVIGDYVGFRIHIYANPWYECNTVLHTYGKDNINESRRLARRPGCRP